jgi:hypothetical protein
MPATAYSPIGSEFASVAPVILGAGHREAVAEPIELIGIDPIDANFSPQGIPLASAIWPFAW